MMYLYALFASVLAYISIYTDQYKDLDVALKYCAPRCPCGTG